MSFIQCIMGSFRFGAKRTFLQPAPARTPEEALERAIRLGRRYRSSRRISDLDEAIRMLQNAVVASKTNPLSLWLALSEYLIERHDRLGNDNDLHRIIAACARSVDLMHEAGPNKQMQLSRLAIYLVKRFERLGQFSDLERAIETHQQAIQLMPIGSPEAARPLMLLSVCLRLRFDELHDLSDLQSAIESSQRAVKLTPSEADTDKPKMLHNLGLCLHRRFDTRNELPDLVGAIAAYRHAVKLSRDDDMHKPESLACLSISLHRRFVDFGDLQDLDDAIAASRSAAALARKGHPGKPAFDLHYSLCFRKRFEKLGKLQDLESAIHAGQRAVKLADVDRPDYGDFLVNLYVSLYLRFNNSHNCEDLDEAITLCQRAVELSRDDPASKAERFSHLNVYLLRRFEHLGELNGSESPEQLLNLGRSLLRRFEHVDELNDLECAISAHQRAVTLLQSHGSESPEQFLNLGRCLLRRFERLHEPDELESAILALQKAFEDLHDDHLERREGLRALGSSLQYHFDLLGELDDLHGAISTRRSVIELTPVAHPDMPDVLEELGCSLLSRFRHERSLPHFNDTRTQLMAAINQPLGKPSTRLRASMRLTELLSESSEYTSVEEILLVHSRIIDLLPEIAWLGHSVKRRFEETARLGELVNRAVGVAISAGALRQAVEWLEAGRTLVWAQILSLRTPLDDIGDHHPDLARALFDVRSEIQRSDSAAGDRHGETIAEYERLMNQIRHCVGCQNSLRPRTLASLTTSPAFGLFSGTLILINVAQSSCDALIVSSAGDVRSVHLPQLTHSRALKMNAVWKRHVEVCGLRQRGVVHPLHMRGNTSIFARVLERLWTWVVDPILRALGMTERTQGHAAERLPHVVWSPTGPLTQLPLHAAGIYDSSQPGPRVFDFVVSSYIPSLSALLRCCEGVVKEYPAPNALVVTQPGTPGHSLLPGTRDESAKLSAILPEHKHTLLDHSHATVESTLAVIGRHPWVHFACHGTQNLEDPTQSAFALYDGPLTLNALMGTVAHNAELAFLSACQTATGDDKIPEESAHLAAGMLAVGFKGVIATMWSIGDADAPIVVEAYYKKLLELRGTGYVQRGQTGAAYALHEATRHLREELGEHAFERWIPFVHFGV